ncbi:MAG: hypothetical protein V1727_01635 [Candidatus Omnitrophota bacterium]
MFTIEYPFKKEILACGTKEWSGICLTKKNHGYVINELFKLQGESFSLFYQREVDRIKRELKITPRVIAHDLYPEYETSRFAQEASAQSATAKLYAIQHHQAHIASCIAENKIDGKVLAVILDNAEYGDDSTFWGGDFFVGDLNGFKRRAYFQPVNIADANNRPLESWQQAAVFLYRAFGEGFIDLPIEFVRKKTHSEWQALIEEIKKPAPCGSCATAIFDAVAALIGVRDKAEFEGQGAADLERIINRSSHVANRFYEFELQNNKDVSLIQLGPTFHYIVEDLRNNTSKSIISAVFYNTLIEIIRQLSERIGRSEKIKDIVIAGSIFQNKVFFKTLKEALAEDGFTVFSNRQFAHNDSSICFGQAVLANNADLP